MGSPTLYDMITYICRKYGGTIYHKKVSEMDPKQIYAIYNNIIDREARLKQINSDIPGNNEKREIPREEWHQIDMFEFSMMQKYSKNKSDTMMHFEPEEFKEEIKLPETITTHQYSLGEFFKL